MSTGMIGRLRAVRQSSDGGLTLPEVLVAMVLSVVIGAMTLTMVVQLTDSTSRTTDHTNASSAARNVLQAWTAYLRVADGPTPGNRAGRVEWLTANDMFFYADLANRSISSPGTTGTQTMFWLRRDSLNQLVEEQFPATAAANATPAICRVLMTNLTGSAAVFGGLTSSNLAVSGGIAPTPSAGCKPLPSQHGSQDANSRATLLTVYSVTIDFSVVDSRKAHPIEFTSQAVLPSLGVVG